MNNTETKHTPGPWVIGTALEFKAVAIFPASAPKGVVTDTICLISPIADMTEVDKANADLIQASPGLLRAAILLVEAVKNRKGTEHELKVSPIEIYRLREAIFSATGNML